MAVAVVGVYPGFSGGGERGGADLGDGVERVAGVSGNGVGFDVAVGDGDLCSEACGFRSLVFEALNKYSRRGRRGC